MRLAGGIPRIVLTAAAVVGLLASGLLLAAEDPAPGGPVQFRRIYVPAERIGEIPAAQGRIVPMDAARFAELLERAERPPGETATAVENIQYTARLEGDALLTGRATLQIRHTGDPVLLPLGTCLAAVQHAVWQRGATRVPARLGADAQQRLVVLVQQAGVLEFEFALQGRSDAVGNWRFPLQLPTAPQHELTCQFPASATASVVGGVVTAVDVDDKQQTWTIQWPPSGQADLVLARPPTDESLRANFLRQADQYALGLDGLELTTTVSLDVQREPLQELVLQLDKSLQLVDVRLGAQQIAWSPREGEGAAGRLVSLQFPQPLAGTQRAVVIRALAPLQTRQSWRLPRIRPQGFVWLEGTCTLLVSEPLTLARLNVDRGRQSKITSLPGSHAGESLEFQFHSPQAGIDVVLANKPGRLATDTLTSIEIADQKLNARVVLDASAEDGSFYALHGTVGQGWQITSVVSDADTNPPGIAVQWSQVGSRVSFWLPRGLAPQRPLRLTLRAVKDQPSPARRLRSPLLRVVTLEGTHHARHRLHLWTQRPYRLQAEGEASTPVAEAGSLPAADRQRLGLTNLTGLCWEDQPREGEVVIAVRRESPAYQVENDVVVEVSEQQIRYRYRIRCQPSSRPVDRLVVHFTATDSVAPDWTLAEMAGVKITARRLRGAEQRRWGLGAGGQTWELSWNRSLRDTFQLLGRCEVPGAGQQAVSLMATPTAATQTGRLTVLGTDTARLDLRRDGLQPLPIPAQRWEVFSSVRGYYRYDPLREMTATRPALVMTASDTSP
ncbi:MAG: hypothetical protein GTO03_15155, partial [Planctomycetales bacterium]|nr:hypothetical protein [Planctomycetales bacterium]